MALVSRQNLDYKVLAVLFFNFKVFILQKGMLRLWSSLPTFYVLLQQILFYENYSKTGIPQMHRKKRVVEKL